MSVGAVVAVSASIIMGEFPAKATPPRRKTKDKVPDFEVRLEAPQAMDVATRARVTIPRALTIPFPAGTGAVEAGTSSHVPMVRNETGTAAEAVVTYMVPVGTPQSQLRADRPDPGNCPF